jgi:FimV-like protein
MMTLITKQYFNILMGIGISSLLILILGMLGLFWLFKDKKSVTKKSIVVTEYTEHTSDISAIAGDDVVATQLDLARAYIETGKSSQAKKILEYVLAKGNEIQQKEARDLLLVCAA